MNEAIATAPSTAQKIKWRIDGAKQSATSWAINKLLRGVVRLVGKTNSVMHARRELGASVTAADGPDRWMADAMLQLIAVHSSQGHSGFSSSYAVATFAKLARFEPLGPITGEAHEWVHVADSMWQNNRCGHIFKDSIDGPAYDTEGRIFREPNGACFTSKDSRVFVTFPYTPTREYVDVPADRE